MAQDRMAREVAQGLGDPLRKWIPPTYFYDQEGSQLYEAITELPEYYPTRTEADLLRRILPNLQRLLAGDRRQPQPQGLRQIVELGSGSSTKTRLLFDLFAPHEPAVYIPIDVSHSMLDQTARRLVEDYPRLRVLGLVGQYEEALDALPPAQSRLVIFLGGTIGNFTPAFQSSFFSHLGRRMVPGNHLLLGFDRRAHRAKPAQVIHDAYNDAQGVTARFNLNLLRRLNRELGANFDLSAFAHRAIYDQAEHQIEMHLVSLRDQTVRLAKLGRRGRSYHFKKSETLLTELSRKFDPAELAAWFVGHGFQPVAQWTDEREYFGLMLLRKERG